jgi:hypothetical protein
LDGSIYRYFSNLYYNSTFRREEKEIKMVKQVLCVTCSNASQQCIDDAIEYGDGIPDFEIYECNEYEQNKIAPEKKPEKLVEAKVNP